MAGWGRDGFLGSAMPVTVKALRGSMQTGAGAPKGYQAAEAAAGKRKTAPPPFFNGYFLGIFGNIAGRNDLRTISVEAGNSGDTIHNSRFNLDCQASHFSSARWRANTKCPRPSGEAASVYITPPLAAEEPL
jgi:hypothetical protein